MTLSNMANASNEKFNQRVMILKRNFNDQKWVTVQSVMQATGYTEATVLKWAKAGNVPLLKPDGAPVVPLTKANRPRWI